jgi:hypothetical protein
VLRSTVHSLSITIVTIVRLCDFLWIDLSRQKVTINSFPPMTKNRYEAISRKISVSLKIIKLVIVLAVAVRVP